MRQNMDKNEFETAFHKTEETNEATQLTTKRLKMQQDEISNIANIYNNIPCMAYGLRSFICLIEEISELTIELMNFHNGKDNKMALLEEIADVIICTECVRTLTEQKMQSEQQTPPEHHIPVKAIYSQHIVEPPELDQNSIIQLLCLSQQQLTKYIRKNKTEYDIIFRALNCIMGVIKFLCVMENMFTEKQIYTAIEVKIQRDINRRKQERRQNDMKSECQKVSEKLEHDRTIVHNLSDMSKKQWYIENPSTKEPLCYNGKAIIFTTEEHAKTLAESHMGDDEYNIVNKNLAYEEYLMGDNLIIIREDVKQPNGSYSCTDYLTENTDKKG